MSSLNVPIHEVKSITECTICKDVMNTPKILPCLHTFCLKCIERFCEDKQEGEAVPCPMCRTAFNIPVGGLSKLNNNFFIEKLITTESSSACSNVDIIYDICFTGKQIKQPAAIFCEECEENMCKQCVCIHKNMKMTKLHKVKPLIGINQEADKPETSHEICDHHQELIKFYCDECKSVGCKKCVEDSHNNHNCFDIEVTIRDLKASLETDCKSVTEIVTVIEMQSGKMEANFSLLKKNSKDVKERIKERGESLKKIVDMHVDHALERVNDFDIRMAKRYEMLKDDSLRKTVDVTNFTKYCEEVSLKASPTDFLKIANDLHSKAQDLKKATAVKFEIYPEFSFCSSDFKIINEGITSTNNIVGTCFEKLQVSRGVQGVAASDKHFYVLYSKSPDIEVYDGEIPTYQETISIPDLYDPSDIVYNGKHLFVSDREDRTIRRIQLSDKTVKKFNVEGRPMSLSSTRDGNVMVSCLDPPVISEQKVNTESFSTSGIRLSLEQSSNCVYHAICSTSINTPYLACCAKNSETPSVCHVSGSNPQRLFDVNDIGFPCYFAIDNNGFIMIVDRNGNRVLKVDVENRKILEIVLPAYVGLNRPYKICLQEELDQLYVCEYGNLDKISIFNYNK